MYDVVRGVLFGQYIIFDQAELYGLFVLIQICGDHHLNVFTFIIVASGCLCCVMSLCHYVYHMYALYLCVFACNCTCVLV